MKNKIPITISHPLLLKEWDYNLNELNPDDLTYGSSKKVFWKCPINHSWEASIHTRVKGHGCPYCRSSTSLNELIIFSELIFIFPNAIHRYVKDKNEIDIFIPDINIGVEYDGFRWHREKELKDRSKNLFFENIGVKIIRVRQKGLPKLSNDDIITDKKIYTKSLIDEILSIILNTRRATDYYSKIIDYLELNEIANESKYQELLAYHPFPFRGKSLEDKFPNLTSEWHISKNKNLTPNHFYPQSATLVWWICSKGHEWKSRISHRVNGSNCPYCTGRIAGIDNNLSLVNQTLVNEWNHTKNKLKPENYLANSGKKVWWICLKKHEWQATIASRNSSGSNCPICSGNIVEESNSIFYNNKLISIWNFNKNKNINPKKISANSNKKVWWMCEKKHEWESIISNITKGSGCPYCSGRKATIETSFGSNFPEILKEWDFSRNELNPLEVSCQSKKKIWWKCINKHEWQTTVQNRTLGSKCPVCKIEIFEKTKSIYALEPNLMNEWDKKKNLKLDPKKISTGSEIKAWWICKNNHSWEATIYHRVKNNSGCPYCSNRIVPIENSIISSHPELIKEWDFEKNSKIKPELFSHGSSKKVFWNCSEGHNWLASISKRANGTSCPECYKLKRNSGAKKL